MVDLVANPVGAFLPPAQEDLERDTREYLESHHGIVFDHLFTITNMPISRFAQWLDRGGLYDQYMDRLQQAYNPATVPALMCRTLISVSWDGRIFDCDFNQMLEMEDRRPRRPADDPRARHEGSRQPADPDRGALFRLHRRRRFELRRRDHVTDRVRARGDSPRTRLHPRVRSRGRDTPRSRRLRRSRCSQPCPGAKAATSASARNRTVRRLLIRAPLFPFTTATSAGPAPRRSGRRQLPASHP